MLLVADTIQLPEILDYAFKQNASDVELIPGRPIMLRVDGGLKEFGEKIVTEDDTNAMKENYTVGKDIERFTNRHSCDVAWEPIEEHSYRARLQFYDSLKGTCLSCRLAPLVPRTMEELRVPSVLRGWVEDEDAGVVIISGLPSTGKTSTLAAIVDDINTRRTLKIDILEDPIEYIHPTKQSLIVSMEVGKHTPSFADGMRDMLRRKIDIAIIGEVRSSETMDAALTMAEIGFRVFLSIHASSVVGTLKRINTMLPSDNDLTFRRLSSALKGVICQKLLPAKKGGRIMAAEIYTNNDMTRALLWKGDMKQIYDELDRNTDTLCSMKMSTENLERQGLI
jgi:twitching motility protein PilT